MDDISIIKTIILEKLLRSNIIGGKHIPLDFIKKSIPEIYRNTHSGKKSFAHALKDLLNNQWLIIAKKRTGKDYDYHVSLNPRKIDEINEFVN